MVPFHTEQFKKGRSFEQQVMVCPPLVSAQLERSDAAAAKVFWTTTLYFVYKRMMAPTEALCITIDHVLNHGWHAACAYAQLSVSRPLANNKLHLLFFSSLLSR